MSKCPIRIWSYHSNAYWSIFGLHNSIKSYANGTMICLLIVNVHKDMFYSNAGAFSAITAENPDFGSILGVKKGNCGPSNATKVHMIVC